MTTKQKLLIAPAAIFGLILLLGLRPRASADDLLRQAREQKLAAMQEHCLMIPKRTEACYREKGQACKKLEESIAWFAKEYGQYPELACSTADPFFLLGANK